MRTIIAGSRTCRNEAHLQDALAHAGWMPITVISGGAFGADQLGEFWARRKGIPIEVYKPDWNGLGKSAGYIRNREMADKAEALIALWDGKSKGTKHMIDIALEKGLVVLVWRVNNVA